MLQGSALLLIAAVVGGVGMLGAAALRNVGAAKRSDRAKAAGIVSVAQSTDTQLVASQPAPSTGLAHATAVTAPPTRVSLQGEVSRARNGTPRPAPVVALGESSLGDGITAVRDDSGIVLAFDTPETRTRIPEKFERFVRATLPKLYGPAADSALAKVPNGGIASTQQALLYDLPTRGIRIALANSWWLVLYPEIRPGQDGPLVVRYRSSVVDHDD